MSRADDLLSAQTELYGRLSRSYENMAKSGAAKITLGLLEARLQTLESYWKKFVEQHEELVVELGDDLKKEDYHKLDLMTKADDAYHTQKGQYLDEIREMRGPLDEAPTSPRTREEAPARQTAKLPRIAIPQFSGRYEDWPAFRDLFISLVVRSPLASPVEKLHYLKASLKGEAEQVTRNLPMTDTNFEPTWRALVAHYENRRLLAKSYVSRLLELAKMKSESAPELRKIYHCVNSTIGSLEGIGRPLTRSDDLCVQLISGLLDPVSRREWETQLSKTTEPPSLEELLQFLNERMRTLESLQPAKEESTSPKATGTPSRQTRTLQARKQESQRGRCFLCDQDHYLRQCGTYLAKSVAERRQYVEAKGLCLNCLGRHTLSNCPSNKTCVSCRARHHTTLHEACLTAAVVNTHQAAGPPLAIPATVLLATARVRVADRFGVEHTARALIDQGSESSLVSESLAQRLRLARAPSSVAVFGVGGVQTGLTRGLVNLRISPLAGGETMTVPALVFPRLTLYDSAIQADRGAWTHLSGLELADPEFLTADAVDLLLGADVYAAILQPGLVKGGPQEPMAQKTSLGWILSGPVGTSGEPPRALALQCRVEEGLTALVRGFWQQEEPPSAAALLTPEEQTCEDAFRRTHSRNADGRYVVRLPIVNPLPDLSATRHSAVRVLTSMERRFARDERLRQLYRDFMVQYDEMDHMTMVEPSGDSPTRVSYLPHHGVLRETSSTTKLRVVFNGSTALPTGESLNRCLLVGPNLLPPLADILLRWRNHRYVFATDVEKMYRQILVHPEDRDLQRIVWRCDPRDHLREYRLNTVTYGLACAPFLAMRALRQLADDEEETYPRGADVLRRDVYMDDVLTGADTLDRARDLQRQLTDLCMAGGFPLRKWSSNHPDVLADVPEDHRVQREPRGWRPQEAHPTLGLQWHPAEDAFSFSTQAISVAEVTKRSVLSLTARLFDPLGWLAPIVVSAKIAFQATWLQGVDWDEPLDEAATRRWRAYQSELPLLERVRVPRWLACGGTDVQLHGFADASERAYAAVIYLRAEIDGAYQTTLVMAKTKVAPIKPVSLPRLELCAAALLARLAAHVLMSLKLSNAALHLWSDSTVALSWIRSHPTRWKTYVANRVADIQTTVPETRWRHVPGVDNPADCASRGIPPGELVKHSLWWRGPSWLRAEPSSWPSQPALLNDGDLPEERTRCLANAAIPKPAEEPAELLRFSDCCA
ncbi:PREDICTED: uncharacterized protein LOC105449468 [Wasmannia auropunctata]|uniref:uncharacterized protein LOC105449468 n=1 Tax=Wasmannia auropunctata TaxID=64793 RepID=UPI0005EDF702|nr:PREDICTED: uncharacterized protein LOC105449468 [Wasmannia auropunctata]